MQSSEENTTHLVNHWTRHIQDVFNKSFQLIPGQERVLKISILSNRYFQLVVLQTITFNRGIRGEMVHHGPWSRALNSSFPFWTLSHSFGESSKTKKKLKQIAMQGWGLHGPPTTVHRVESYMVHLSLYTELRATWSTYHCAQSWGLHGPPTTVHRVEGYMVHLPLYTELRATRSTYHCTQSWGLHGPPTTVHRVEGYMVHLPLYTGSRATRSTYHCTQGWGLHGPPTTVHRVEGYMVHLPLCTGLRATWSTYHCAQGWELHGPPTTVHRVEGYMVHLPLYSAFMNAGPSTDCCSAKSLCLLLMTTTMMMMTTMITTTITSRTPRAAPTPASSGVGIAGGCVEVRIGSVSCVAWVCVKLWKSVNVQSTSSLTVLQDSNFTQASFHQ